MPQLLTLSRAARLVGITRGALQKRISRNELQTFEGMVKVSDLLRAFPDVRLEDDSTLERVRRIRADAVPKSESKSELPAPEVLASRLAGLSGELTEARAELSRYSGLLEDLEARLRAGTSMEEPALRGEFDDILSWLAAERARRPLVPRRKAQLLAKDTFLRLLAAQVRVIPSGHEFFVEGSDPILESALRAGLALRYGCTSGSCGKCKARVLKGDVLKVREHEYEISETERNLGYVLACSYTAVTDLTIEAEEAQQITDIPEQDIAARIAQVARPEDTLAILQVRTPKTENLRFLAGQSARLVFANGSQETLPLASCPCDGQNLEFHLRRRDGSAFSTSAFSADSLVDEQVRVTGPYGEFSLTEDSPAPQVFIALDEGFAPVKSLIENAISIDMAQSYQLHWYTSRPGGHYMENRCRAWRDALDNFQYSAALLEDDLADHDRRELLQAQLAALPDLANCEVYVAGTTAFEDAVSGLLREAGLPEKQLHLWRAPEAASV